MWADTIMALTVLGTFFVALGTLWYDEHRRCRKEREHRNQIESLQRRDCS